jgi:hypothetical protein
MAIIGWLVGFAIAHENAEKMTVPGAGRSFDRDCVLEVRNGEPVTSSLDMLLPSHCFQPSASGLSSGVNPQVYALDVHMQSTAFTGFNATWIVPAPPSKWMGFGEVNYLWPGFKSHQPDIGYPVLQPVLQYGQNGAEWQLQSWFVNQQSGGHSAANAPPIDIIPGDKITSYMYVLRQKYKHVDSVWAERAHQAQQYLTY